MLQGIERYLKQAIVDKNASVSSASLVSALVSVSVHLSTVLIESSGGEAKTSCLIGPHVDWHLNVDLLRWLTDNVA